MNLAPRFARHFCAGLILLAGAIVSAHAEDAGTALAPSAAMSAAKPDFGQWLDGLKAEAR
jgi:hypothetical protein